MTVENLPYEEWRDNLIRHFCRYQNFVIRPFSLYRSHTGLSGAKYINSLKPKAVLDVGCGANNFKNVIHNLTGIDLIHYPTIATMHRIPQPIGADIVGDVLHHYKNLKNKFDIIFCVGALNDGDENHICEKLELFKDLVGKGGRIFGHVRPGQTNDLERNEKLGFLHYSWTFDEALRIASVMNLEVVALEIEHTQTWRMPDEMIVMYKEMYDNREMWITADGKSKSFFGDDPTELAKCIDPNIKTTTNTQQQAAINNEYNRRFNPDKYVKDHPDMGMRYRLYWELVVK